MLIAILAILVLNTVCLFNLFTSKPKLAYVKSQELVYGYMGMKEAETKFDIRSKKMLSSVDSLKYELQRAIQDFNTQAETINPEILQKQREKLRIQEMNIQKYEDNIQDKLIAEESEMLEGILNQINSFVEQYAKEKNYQYIFGTTTAGNLLYADDTEDITQEVLEHLNKNYSDS